MVAGEIIPKLEEHYFVVARHGGRSTYKYFSNLRDATKYYDSLCKRNKGKAEIRLYEKNPPNSPYISRMVYTNDKRKITPYRDVSKEKSKSSTTGFGFPKPKKDGWPNVKV